MTSQTTASERDESRRKRRSNDTNTATRDADSSDDGLDTGASRDMSTTRRDVSDPAAGGESLPTDRQPSSRAARLQQAQGNRAVARAAAAARDRLDGSESREGNGSLEDAPGGAPPERSDGSTTTEETAATLSSSSGHPSGPSTSVRTKPTPDISPTDAGRATSREPVEAGSSPPDTAAPRGVEQDIETDQQGERQPATRSGANAANPSPSREGSTPTRALGGPDGLVAQPKLEVDQSNDKYEREADTVAKAVAAGRSASAVSTLRSSRRNGDTPDQTGEDGAERVQPRTDDTGGNPSRGPSNGAESISRPGSGRSLPDGVRRLIEPTLGTNLGEVQVHTGTRAARATSSVGARALTHRNHIFVGGGESPHDVRLMAHEATHVVQQGAASQASRTTSSTPDVQPLLGQSALEKLNDYAEYIPGWTLLTVLVGYNPLLGKQVEPTPENFLEGLIGLIPGAKLVLDALRRFEVVEKASQVLRETISEFNLNPERLKQTLENAWNDLDTLDLIVSMGESAREVIEKHFVPLKDDAVAFARSLVDRLIGVAKEAAIDVAERLLPDTAAWNLLTKLMGKDPLRDEEVETNPPGILADTLRLIGAEQHLEKMREEGTFEETAAWFGEQIGRFKELIGRLEGLVETAWAALTPKEIGNLWSNLESLASDVGEFLADVVDFAEDVASEVLSRIKDALLSRLDGFAKENVPGFHLLTVIIEKNPFTGENVARIAEALIGGFVRLLPNGHAIYQELADSGVIAEAGARIDAAVEQLGIGWEMIVNLFQGVWDSLSIEDLLDPVGAFQRVVEEFRGPISRIVRFVTTVLREIFHVAVAAMNFPTDLVGSIISNVMGAIDAVKRDPIGFVTNMLEAVKLGFQNFFDNILTHLAGGLTDWLFRGLRDAGIEPPADFSLGSVLEFVLEIIGVTTDRIWEGIAERIGEENVERIRTAMDALTGIWEFVRDVQRQGIGAIWEYVTSQIRGLWDTVTEMAQEWIMERVINRAIRWLAGLLDPSGVTAVINSFQAFFNAVQSAAEYLRDILSIVNDYVSTIAAVAQGQLEAGAQKLEQGLVNAIPVAIGFLANQFGLGNIGQKIEEIVGGIRETVDQAIEWLLDRAEAALDRVLSAIGMGEEETEMDSEDEIEPTEPGDYEAFARSAAEMFKAAPLEGHESSIAAARAFAEEHEPKLSEQLPDDVGLTFEFSEDPETVADGVLEFTVVVAPNSSRATDEKALDCPSPGTSSDNIGVIGLHGKKPPSEDHYEFEVHYLRSEHIIPFRCTNILREAVGFNETARDKLRRFEKRQTTLMIYKQAGLMKDREDDAIISEFKSEFYATDLVDIISRAKSLYHLGNETQGEELAMRAQAAVLSALEALKANAVERTKRYIHEEWQLVERGCEETNGQRRDEPHPLPDPDGGKVEEAADRQYDEVELLVANNLLAWFKQELELPDWEAYSIHEDGVRQMLQEAGYNKPYQRDDGRWVIPRPGDQNLLKLTVDEEGMIHIGEI